MCRSQAGSIDSAVIALLEKGRERREATRGEAPKRWDVYNLCNVDLWIYIKYYLMVSNYTQSLSLSLSLSPFISLSLFHICIYIYICICIKIYIYITLLAARVWEDENWLELPGSARSAWGANEDIESPFHASDLARGVVQLGQVQLGLHQTHQVAFELL